MISTVLALAVAATTAQPADNTRAPRDAYNACLRQFMQRSIEARTALTEFETALAQQCGEQASALRNAVLQRDGSTRSTRASAEQNANEELNESRNNFLERYRYAMEPQ